MLINISFALIIISIIVVVHEFGHLLFSKLFGLKVFEFSIGFGKSFFQHKFKETLFSLRVLPLGGYVRIAGIDKTDSGEIYSDKQSFMGLGYLKKFLILFAGSFFNFIFAFVLLFFIYFALGVPQGVSNTIESVKPKSPAYEMQLMKNDVITQINGKSLSTGKEIVEQIRKSGGKGQYFTIERNKESFKVLITPLFDKKQKAYLAGFKLQPQKIAKLPFFKALSLSIKDFMAIFYMTFMGLITFFTGQVNIEQISGPIGIVSLTGEMVNYGLAYLGRFMVILAINIAILNLLPIPALDGGRIFILTLEKLFRRDFKEATVNKIHYAGALFLMVLIVYVTFFDVKKIFIG